MGNSDEQQKDKPVVLGRMQAFFAALMHGISFPSQRGGSSHGGGSIPPRGVRARRLRKNKAAKQARKDHRFG